MMKAKRFAFLIAFSLLLTIAGCAAGDEIPTAPAPTTEPAPQVTEVTEPDLSSDTTHRFLTNDPVLIARRETVEADMRKQANFIWRCEEDLLYTVTSDITPDQATGSAQLELKAGRLYRGIPYSFGGASLAVFMDHLSGPDEQGIYSLSGLDWQLMSGSGGTTAQVGTDCHGAITKAWGQINASIQPSVIVNMVPDRGYLRVGAYTSGETENPQTRQVCHANGKQIMYEAYAQLQAGDMIIRRDLSTSHSRMITQVRVVRNADGAINPAKSRVTIVEQTRTNFRDEDSYFHESLGETVYEIYGIDKVFSFSSLYEDGYLPITCRELIDPTPIAEPEITDSLHAHTADTLCAGTLTCNWFMDNVFITVTDSAGTVVRQLTLNIRRGGMKQVDLQQFCADYPQRVHGSLDTDALAPGQYRCILTVRLGNEQELTVRDFSFSR